jgi:hypothetical protein
MRDKGRVLWLGTGLILGVVATAICMRPGQSARAANSDRFEDYVMCTGTVSISPRAQTEALWMLDYRKGKLLSTIVDRSVGKILGWAELDLVNEFGVQPRQDVHFMMTTGNVTQGQAVLYLAEVNSGKIGVYTLGPAVSGSAMGFTIRRNDLSIFRGGVPVAVAPVGPGAVNANGGDAGPHRANHLPFAGPDKAKQ